MKLLCLLLLILLNHRIQISSDNLLHNICFYLSNNTIRFHYNVIFISSLYLVLKKELLPVDLRSHCNGIDIFVFFEGSFNYYDYLLIVDIICVLFNHHIAAFIAVYLHQIQDLLDLLFA